ncbi:site-specific integrase [uncultured Fibrobacter sp.]|uniref:site-specific integrase n=1 Tax=uncultured Fibrobacter sp. TaxID=261512 RepID=UPI00280593A8|nr:site-specific integrase [uncultured Fibrobacter sp.]
MLFIEFARKYLIEAAETLSPLTVRTYYWNLNKIEAYSPSLSVEEITAEFIRDYRTHLQNLGNKESTVSKALSVFRTFTNKLILDGIITKNPFDRIKIRRVPSQRGFLTIHELKSLYLNFLDRAPTLLKNEQDSLRTFLFSCFTGLRFGDLKTLDAKEIVNWKIHKQMHKTGEAVYIPIPIQARLLLPKINKGRIFHVADNAYFNKRLRSGAKKLGCNRHLHCHMARHTFATTCITIGIPLPVTSKLLGHRNLETTLIYAKYIDVLLDKEMKKFDHLK